MGGREVTFFFSSQATGPPRDLMESPGSLVILGFDAGSGDRVT